MAEPFDIVAAAGTLADAGIEPQKARAVALQLHAAAAAGEPVNNAELEAALDALRTALLEAGAGTDRNIAAAEERLMERFAKSDRRIESVLRQFNATEHRLNETAAETDRRMGRLFWRFFAAMAALTCLAVLAIKYLP